MLPRVARFLTYAFAVVACLGLVVAMFALVMVLCFAKRKRTERDLSAG